jgi:hypothetical protein
VYTFNGEWCVPIGSATASCICICMVRGLCSLGCWWAVVHRGTMSQLFCRTYFHIHALPPGLMKVPFSFYEQTTMFPRTHRSGHGGGTKGRSGASAPMLPSSSQPRSAVSNSRLFSKTTSYSQAVTVNVRRAGPAAGPAAGLAAQGALKGGSTGCRVFVMNAVGLWERFRMIGI